MKSKKVVEDKSAVSLYDKHIVQGESWDWDSTVQLFSAGVFATTTAVSAKGLKGDVGEYRKVVGSKSDIFSMDYQVVDRQFTNSGMRVASVKEVRSYKKMMRKQGIQVSVDLKGKRLPEGIAAGFEYTTGEIVIRKNPTLLSLQHEGLHARQWLEIGQEKYTNIGRLAREEYVYKNLVNSGLLNKAELRHSEWYIQKVRGAERR